MNDIDSSFREQQKLEDAVTFKAIIIQLCINLFFTVSVLILFSWLRPRHAFIYAPKTKLSKSERPARLGPGWFDWIKPVFKIKDDALLQNIGFDGFVFIYFTRMLRQLIVVLTVISMFIFLPVNILATYNTGDWPPAPGLDFMSISAMNYQYGKESKKTNALWYWSPTIATWFFSAIVILQLCRSSELFLQFRRKYYMQQEAKLKSQLTSLSATELLQYQKDDLIHRTLLVHFNSLSKAPPRKSSSNVIYTPNPEMKRAVDAISKLPCEQVLTGKYNTRLYLLVSDYNRIIKSLERVINRYMSQIKQEQHKHNNLNSEELARAISKLKRPMVRLNWRSKKMDAINYYTERALSLDTAIRRNRSKLQNCNYGWAVYPSVPAAHEAFISMQENMARQPKAKATKDTKQCVRLRLAPQPEDIIWPNMNIERHTAELKRWFGYGLFFSILFVWGIPIAMLAVCSNLINFIRLFKESNKIIKNHQLLMGLIQSYLTPLLMVLFHVGLPELLGLVSRQQAYKTNTVVEQKILWKLYMFFVANNLVIFTLVNIMLGIVGQITALTMVGTLQSKKISDYIVQIAKNMSDVSSFWINYVCLRSVGVVFDLLQVVPLLFIVILPNRYAGSYRYTPRQLVNRIGSPPSFQYAKNYGLIISFFTAALVYSVTAPIVLPFALIYFGLATPTFKYKLMYIYVTKTETHGRIWPLLYRIVMLSLIVFQAMMILILSLKAGLYQIYSLIPLPFVTFIIGLLYLKRLKKNNKLKTWVDLNANVDGLSRTAQSLPDESIELSVLTSQNSTSSTSSQSTIARDAQLISTIYLDPCIHEPLWKPMIYDDIKQIVPLVYKGHQQQDRIIKTLYSTEDSTQSLNTTTPQQTPTSETANSTIKVISMPSVQVSEKQLQMQNEEYHPEPPPSINPDVMPFYYQESEDLGIGSSSSSNYFTTSHPLPFTDEMNITTPTAPTLEEMLRDDHDDTLMDMDASPPSPSSPVFIPIAPPTYADVVLPRVNVIQTVTKQKQQRRHST
ncbi:hypothetical protein HMPREF1544_11150 [Mucor circinelloides 1006PhL]|uniref:CSC1/OSCA1-like 7TM region domain-containing protein n=1 Tax=Mucor circinelloides f. circinelloides (strain 1006PhL) TaxID=1220926 RepID=S2IXW1_MUCC1|nr:hypothetical protein HMPREF1544_11150 [Mucor circinelloides 1006PhL]